VFINAFLAKNSINSPASITQSSGNRSSSATSRFYSDFFTEFEKPTDNLEMDGSSKSTSMEISDDGDKKKPAKRKATTDQDGFVLPSRVTRPRQAKSRVLANNSIDTSNRFESLSDDETDPDGYDTDGSSQPPPNPLKKTAKIITKPPKPIYVSSSSFAGVKNSLTSLNLSKTPDFKIVGKQIKVLAHTKDDKQKIQEKMTQTKQAHYTFTEPEDRHLQYVLYGHYNNDVEELKEELIAALIPASKVIKVNRSIDNPIFLISFEKSSGISLRTLQNQHSKLNSLIVRWAKFQPNQRRPTQCHRCQRFGHSANNCALPFRCVKCLSTHEPGQCARTTRDGNPSCVNCGTEGHASNSTTCPAYKKHVEIITAKKHKVIRDRQPREFPATRHEWIQHPAPTVASQPAQSTSQSQPVNRNNREYRPTPPSHVNRPNPVSSNPFSQLREIQAEFAAIPGIQESIARFARLVHELKYAQSESERTFVFLKYCDEKSLQSNSQP
jgi:hypothetical protein